MKYFMLMALLCLLFCSVSAQKSNAEWLVYKDLQDVKIEYKYSDCYLDNAFYQKWVLLKFTNKTNHSVKLDYGLDLYYNTICKTCDKQEYSYSIALQPNEVLAGECDLNSPTYLRLFVQFLDMDNREVLTDFQLSNLNTIKL